jgi:hypothetical protein
LSEPRGSIMLLRKCIGCEHFDFDTFRTSTDATLPIMAVRQRCRRAGIG